jgi:hypothetical protein
MKKLFALLLTLALFFPSLSFAAETEVNPCASASSVISTNTGKGFADSLCGLSTTDTGTVIRNVIIAILVIATLLSLFFLIRGGLNWILSGGDKAKIAAARETLVAAVLGLIVTFLAYFILNVVLSLFGLGFKNLVIPNITGKSSSSTTLTCAADEHIVTQANGIQVCIPN